MKVKAEVYGCELSPLLASTVRHRFKCSVCRCGFRLVLGQLRDRRYRLGTGYVQFEMTLSTKQVRGYTKFFFDWPRNMLTGPKNVPVLMSYNQKYILMQILRKRSTKSFPLWIKITKLK